MAVENLAKQMIEISKRSFRLAPFHVTQKSVLAYMVDREFNLAFDGSGAGVR